MKMRDTKNWGSSGGRMVHVEWGLMIVVMGGEGRKSIPCLYVFHCQVPDGCGCLMNVQQR